MQNKKIKIQTALKSTPSITVPASFTALHLAHISWNLYSSYAPTHYANEFTIHDGGDFAMYNIEDSKCVSEHYYDCAFYIGELVQENTDYSVQEAFDLLDDVSADTCVREEASSTLVHTIQQFVKHTDYNKYTQLIAEDYAHLLEDSVCATADKIAQLEKHWLKLTAKQNA